MNFRLSKLEEQRVKYFRNICLNSIVESNKKIPSKYEWKDADALEFIVSNCGIGYTIYIRNTKLGIKANITDYDSW